MGGAILRTTVSALVILSLASCTGQPGAPGQPSISRLFGDTYLDASDPCIAQRKVLADQGSWFDKELVQSAAAGAIAGGLIAALTGGSGRQVLVGAAIGAGLGLAGGYLAKLQRDGLDGSAITERASSDIRTENAKIDAAVGAFEQLDTCRRGQGKLIQRAYNRKEITRDQAEAQMAAVRTRRGEDIAKFREVARQVSDNSRNYAAIYNDIAADNDAEGLEVQDYQRGRASVARTPTARKVAGTQPNTLKTRNRQAVTALQRDCLTNVKKRDECIAKVEKAESSTQEFDLG